MTVVPLAMQLTAWIPAWWRAQVGGDDLLELVGAEAVSELSRLRDGVVTVTAYCPELGVGVLPGPKPLNEAAVAAGQAVILASRPGEPSHVLLPGATGWELRSGGPARPSDLDLAGAAAELAESVVTAEHELRETATTFDVGPQPASVRPLPPDAPDANRALLVRSVRLWTAVAAVPEQSRTEAMNGVLRCAARATLAAYQCQQNVGAGLRRYA